ncbi:DNA N-6-adenine-methyltransferase [Pseudophaeobacter sp. C1-32P7]|uniref:DNA N-6-adenine-methyltransferase n=1 Tax=Pseudophaeobacter sp. C1-32P7 TaxID=3098142 RepID=UPI0034D457EC
MASYEKQGESDEWYTPAYIFEALGVTFNLDVACPPEGPRYVPANSFYSEGSLELEWTGFVWMNPPFGHQSTKRLWLRKFFDHGNGIALLPDRTSAPWWQEFAPLADAVLFVSPKVKFERPDGSIGEQPGTGTTLFAAGAQGAAALLRASSLGQTFHPARRAAA